MVHRLSHAEAFLRRFDGHSMSIKTRFYAKVPGLRAARFFGWVTSHPAISKGWRHTLTGPGTAALANALLLARRHRYFVEAAQ